MVYSVSCRVGADGVLSPPNPSHLCVSVFFLATGCYALPWLTLNARQWTVSFRPHLLLCYEPVKLTSPLVIHPPFAWQQGPLTYILSWAFQLALVGLRYLRVLQSSLAGWLLRPDIVCSMSHDSGLSSPGLICCYAMSPWCLTYSSWLYAHSLLGNRVR